MSIFVLAFLIAFLFTIPAFANPACAVCTVAVGAALGISRERIGDIRVNGAEALIFCLSAGQAQSYGGNQLLKRIIR